MQRRNIVDFRRQARSGLGGGQGAAPPPAFSGPVDALIAAGVTPLAAYSTSHRLYSGYTGALFDLERVTGGTFADIPYAAGTNRTDTAAMDSHCLGSNGRIRTLYEQTGAVRDVTQGTAAARPKIYDSATGVTYSGTLPTPQFAGASFQGWSRADACSVTGNQAVAAAWFGAATAGAQRRAVMVVGPAAGHVYFGAEATTRHPIVGIDGVARRNFTVAGALAANSGLVFRKANGANISASTCRQDGVDLAQASVVAGVPAMTNTSFMIGLATGLASVGGWDGTGCSWFLFADELAAGAALTAIEAWHTTLGGLD